MPHRLEVAVPLALRDLQRAFAAHLAGEDQPALVADIRPAAARLFIHRHHVLDSLASALASTFPTVQALVGADFFRDLARAFIGRSLPSQPVLAEYGADFPAFIADHEAARDLPYLADVARLDWALNLAFHAPAGSRLTAADLAAVPTDRLPSLRLGLAPGTALISSPFPLDRIWAASQPGSPADPVDLDGGGADLLVVRRPDDAVFVALPALEAAFFAGVSTGLSLEEASCRADSSFDLTAAFGQLLALGALAAPQ